MYTELARLFVPELHKQPSWQTLCLLRSRMGNDMTAVLAKALAFMGVIVMAYALKRKGFFALKDFDLISRIVVKITLPCAIVYNFSQIGLDASLLALVPLGIACNVLMVALGYLINRKRSREDRAFGAVNLSGYNIGNFTLPFVQGFLGEAGVASCSLFDTGNAVMCTGLTYSVAAAIQGKKGAAGLKGMAKTLFSSLPFDSYLLMTVLVLFHIELPGLFVNFAHTVGNANPFLALLMIGIGFEIRLDRSKIARLFKMLAVRYGTALLLCLAFVYLAPFGPEVRKALAIIAFGPVSSVATAYTGALGGDVELSSAMNSLSIVISILCITVLFLLL